MIRSVRRVALACALAPLAGCGWFGAGPDDTHRAANAFTGTEDTTETVTLGNGDGLNLPTTVAGFTRSEVRVGNKATEASATYNRAGPPGPITAIVHVQRVSGGGGLNPFSGDGGPDATKSRSDAALTALIAEISRSHPDAAVIGRSDVFLVRFGVVQAGRAAELTATDELGGQRQPVRVLAESFCCVNGKWDYQYRFEAPAGVQAREIENAFARAIAWSREPGASIEQAE